MRLGFTAAIVAWALASSPTLADFVGVVVKRDMSYGPLPERTLTTCAPAGGMNSANRSNTSREPASC